MITYVIGDLFHSPAKVLVNTVNVVGVMGKGIAKDFKTIFPEMFQEYQALCEKKKIDTGKLHLWRGPHKWVLNFPTKTLWRYPSKPEYIESGLKTFVAGYARNSISSIAFFKSSLLTKISSWCVQILNLPLHPSVISKRTGLLR